MKTSENSIRSYDIKVFAIIVLIAVTVYVVSGNITKNKTEFIEEQKYRMYGQNLKNEIQRAITNKHETTYALAFALAQNYSVIESLRQNDISFLNLKEFSNKLSKTSRLNNAWFHIITKEGTSFYRSWVEKRGDSVVDIRMDIAQMIESPKVMNTISTGKFDMSFKSMVPIYDKSEFLGAFEVITHFSSISQTLKMYDNIDSVILVDKSYKEQITRPFTNTFIDDYYVANFETQPYFLEYIQKNGPEKFFQQDELYRLDKKNNLFMVFHNIPDINGKPMGTFIAFKSLDSLVISDLEYIESNMMFYVALIILVLTLIGYYLIVRKHTRELDEKVKIRTLELKQEKRHIQKIVDINPSMIIITKDSNIISGNRTFLDFFHYENLESFKKQHQCICEYFLNVDGNAFDIESKMIEEQPWEQYLSKNYKEEHYVTLKKEKKIYYFTASAIQLNKKEEILVTLHDITDIKNKDKLLFEQSKLASMGEMIGNIAHQWRQPLSIISSGATGMKLQKQFDVLDDKTFNNTCDLIDSNAQYLSTTINDFRDFISQKRQKKDFNLSDEVKKFLSLVEPSIKSHNIQLISQLDESITIYGYPNELIQCFMNLFNNAKDALKEKPEELRVLKITTKKNQKNIKIIFQDSGAGVKESIMDKIFEPYFTTKHQSIGTGLGLHMTNTIVVQGMGGDISVTNKEFIVNNKKYYGASFCIFLNN